MKQYQHCLIVLLAAFMTVSCQHKESPKYIIGVSQCMDDAWRQKMNDELETEQIFHPEVLLRYRQANSNSELQCMQIDSFIAEKIDLLIVSPNEADEVEPAVSRCYQAGIPVVVADRRLKGNDYTAFVGGDNKQVGYIIARCLQKLAQEKSTPLNVLEITGLAGSTPTVLRHQAMVEGLANDKQVRIVAQGCGQWEEAPSERMADSLLYVYTDIDVIVAQNDLMARGAASACRRHNLNIPIIGVDGMTGEHGGVEAILDGIITVTATYPSRGDLVLQRAVQILEGEKYPRNTILKSVLVGPDEASPMALLAEERASQVAAFNELKTKVNDLTQKYYTQKTIIGLLVALLLFVCGSGIALIRFIKYRQRVKQERDEKEQQLQKQQEQLQAMSQMLKQTQRKVPTRQEEERRFIEKLTMEIDKSMSDPELSVETLAADMGMSRSVLFRRVKAAIGQSPIEMIRHQRLQRARHLLESGTMTVQEVAYEVGFSSSGYFARCYKEEFGTSPGVEKIR